MSSACRIVLLGAPGSGKGTQAALLAQTLGIPAVSTGEMLRLAVREGSELGRRVESIMENGELVDDQTMADVVAARLSLEDARGGFILDGYPRNVDQARKLDSILGELNGGMLDAVALIDVPVDELVKRALLRRRADDREEVIRRRLEVFRERTEPLVGRYEKRGLLRRVDGNQPIEAVAHDLASKLEESA